LKNNDKHDLKNEVTCGDGTLLATRGKCNCEKKKGGWSCKVEV
jgi:hypothetical protein